MACNKYNILIIAGGSSRYLSVATHINKLIRIFKILSQNIYLLSSYDAELINLKKDEIFTIKTFQNRYKRFVKSQFQELSIMNKIFKNQKIDIVFFAFGHDLDLVPILFSKIMGKKIILRSDGRPSLILEKYYNNQSAFKKIFFKIIEYINYNLADALVSESNYMLKENSQDLRNKCGVANLPVDMDFFKRKNPTEKRKYDLGYFGQLDEGRGIINLIETIPLIVKKNNNTSVLIGGEGDQKKEIKWFTIKNSLEENIKIVDWIQHENLPDYLNSIKIFILPSYREGLPNIILEAMACGTIVLSTPVGGVPSVIKDSETGFIMENNSIPCIEHHILRVLNYSNLDIIANNAYNLIKSEYSFDSTVKRYDEIIEKV
jgi:glycosyltransferase involved in cell wall biosynthesis